MPTTTTVPEKQSPRHRPERAASGRGREVAAVQEAMRARAASATKVRAIRSGVSGPQRVPAG